MHGHFPVPVVRRFHGLRKHTELLAHYSIRFNLTTRFSRHENHTDSQNNVRRSSANTLSPSFCPSQPHNVSHHLSNTFAKIHNPPAQYTTRVALRTVVSRSHWLYVVGQHRWKQVSRCASNTLTTAKRTTIWFYITCGVIRSVSQRTHLRSSLISERQERSEWPPHWLLSQTLSVTQIESSLSL
jgi:hypothetical protein